MLDLPLDSLDWMVDTILTPMGFIGRTAPGALFS
jgi:hypothetical protein